MGRRDDRGQRPRERDDRGQRTGEGREPRVRAPRIPEDITADMLDKGTLLELRTLPEGLAEMVARHLVAAERALLADDLDGAWEHVAVARDRAGRVAAVREASAIVAYRRGDYANALAELRTVRRMAGGSAYAPMIADCERGLGRPKKALEVIKAVDMNAADVTTRVELLIVASGARADLGQLDAAVVTLQVPELTRLQPGTPRARLQYAYSEALARVGRTNEAWEWMERAAGSDTEGATDAEERCEEFAGVRFSEVEADDPASE